MDKRILKGLMAVVMAAVTVILVLIAVNHVKAGMMTSNSKMMLAIYIVMACYSLYRMCFYLKDVFKK